MRRKSTGKNGDAGKPNVKMGNQLLEEKFQKEVVEIREFLKEGHAAMEVLSQFWGPSILSIAATQLLSDKNPKILFIPPKYANGFRPLELDTRIIFFSTSTLEESEGDDYRFPVDYWGNEVWEVENR